MSDAPAVTVTSDSIIYRASSLGSCFRRLWAARSQLGAQSPPESLQKTFDKGHELEGMILDKLAREFQWVLTDYQKEVSLHVGTNHEGRELYVLGHVDALGTGPGGGHFMPVDAKSFAQSTMDNFLANGIRSFPHYSWQQSAYAVGLGVERFCLPLYNKETGELTVKVYDTLPHSYEDIQDRIFQVEQYMEDRTEMSSIPCTGDWGCPYSYLHDTKPVDIIPDAAFPLINNYLLAKKKIDTYKTVQKVLAIQLQSLLPYTEDLRTFSSPSASVSIVNNPKRMDTQKVKELLTAAGEDLDEYYVPGEGVHIVVKEKP